MASENPYLIANRNERNGLKIATLTGLAALLGVMTCQSVQELKRESSENSKLVPAEVTGMQVPTSNSAPVVKLSRSGCNYDVSLTSYPDQVSTDRLSRLVSDIHSGDTIFVQMGGLEQIGCGGSGEMYASRILTVGEYKPGNALSEEN